MGNMHGSAGYIHLHDAQFRAHSGSKIFTRSRPEFLICFFFFFLVPHVSFFFFLLLFFFLPRAKIATKNNEPPVAVGKQKKRGRESGSARN